MLIARRRLLGYGIYEGKSKLAHIGFSWFGSGGRFVLQGQQYLIKPKGFLFINRYEVRLRKVCVAVIQVRWAPLPQISAVEFDNQHYTIQNQVVTLNGQAIGDYRARRLGNWMWSSIELDLPQQIPSIPRLCLIWTLINDSQLSE